jgi:hypothetical protein
MISLVLHGCSDEFIHSGDIYIIAVIAGLLKLFVVNFFCKITSMHIDKLGIAKIL